MQIREGLCHYLLAIVILFGAPSAAFATEISQGNMRLTLPGNWELRPGAAILTAVSQTHPNTVVLVSVPTEMTAEHIVAYLNRGINGMEQERQVVRRFPEQPQAGFTASGHGFAFQSVASRGVQGDGRVVGIEQTIQLGTACVQRLGQLGLRHIGCGNRILKL